MKIVLTQDVRKLGSAGEVRDVSDGYATNFLIPKGLAEPASPSAVARAESEAKRRRDERVRHSERGKDLALRLGGQRFLIEAQARKGKLFGAVRPRDIVAALSAAGIEGVRESEVESDGNIKKVGVHRLRARFGSETAEFTVEVVERKEE